MSARQAGRRHLVAGLAVASLLSACGGSGNGLGQAGPGSTERLADRSVAAGDYGSAAAFYERAIQSNPKSVDALVGLGRAYTGLGQYSRAEQALLAARERRPGDTVVLLELARTQIAAGNATGALANLDAARKKKPHDIAILTARGIALDRLSRHTEAQATYRDALARYPTDFALLSNLGLSLGLSGHTAEGIAILRELARDGKATAKTRGNLALVFGLAGRDKEAAAALSVDLSQSQIQNNLSYYRELRGLLLQGKPIGNLDQAPSGGRIAKSAPLPAAALTAASAAGPAAEAVLKAGPAFPPPTSDTPLTMGFAPTKTVAAPSPILTPVAAGPQ